MDAIEFNFAINKVLQFGETFLRLYSFSLTESPEAQEDSGDLVSTESITICYRHTYAQLEIRIFLCCGKRLNHDYINIKIIDFNGQQHVDFSNLSVKLGLDLHLKDLNATQKTMDVFLEIYFAHFRQHFDLLFGQAQIELKTAQNKRTTFKDLLSANRNEY